MVCFPIFYTLCAIQCRGQTDRQCRSADPGSVWCFTSLQFIFFFFFFYTHVHEGIHCQKAVDWSNDRMQHRFVSLTIKIKDSNSKLEHPCAHVHVDSCKSAHSDSRADAEGHLPLISVCTLLSGNSPRKVRCYIPKLKYSLLICIFI